MTYEDAASLICAVLGSEAVQDSVQTIGSMRALKADFQGQRFVDREAPSRLPPLELGIQREHDVTSALACVIRFFEREEEYLCRLATPDGRKQEIYVVFEVEYPQHFASLTVGVRNLLWETWTFGHRSHSRNEQLRRCREYQLREVSKALRAEAPAINAKDQ